MAGNGKAVGGHGRLEGRVVPTVGRGVGCTIRARGVTMLLKAGRQRKETEGVGLEEIHTYIHKDRRQFVKLLS